MNALATLIELAEAAALIVLVIYLIRLIRDKDETEPRSSVIDRNLAELAAFNRILVGSPELARIWQDGRADRRLNDIDQERFSLLSNDYLTLLANQQQRADNIQDSALVEATTLKLVDTLLLNPGLLPEWEEIADKVASPALREAVAKAMNPAEDEDEVAPEPIATGEEEEALAGEESAAPAVSSLSETREASLTDNTGAAAAGVEKPPGNANEPATEAEAETDSSPAIESPTPLAAATAADDTSASSTAAAHSEAANENGAGDDKLDAIPAKAS